MTSVQQASDPPAADATSLDESNIISLIRRLLPPSNAPISPTPETQSQEQNTSEIREQSGTLLWDLSVIEAVASVMVNAGMIFPVLEAVITAELLTCAATEVDGLQYQQTDGDKDHASDPARPIEVALGILGNIVAHSELAGLLAEQASLLDLITGPALHTLSSSAALSELCRLSSTALRQPGSSQWLPRLCGQETAERLVWIAHQSRDPVLHARCLDMIVAVLHAELTHVEKPQQQQQEKGNKRKREADEPQPESTAAPSQPAEQPQPNQQPSGSLQPTEQPPTTTAQQGYPCAYSLVQAGLLTLVADVLQQASASGQMNVGSIGSTWAEITPLPGSHTHGPTPTVHRPRQAPTPHLNLRYSVGGTPRLGTTNGAETTLQGTNLGSIQEEDFYQAGLPLSEVGVDAALRAVEVLGALPQHCPEHDMLLSHTGLVSCCVKLLHSTPSEQVLESLLLALQALSSTAVRDLASVSHINALLDCLGELPSGERGAWQREIVVWLTARALQQLAIIETSHAAPTSPPSSSHQTQSSDKQPGGVSSPPHHRLAVATHKSITAVKAITSPSIAIPTGKAISKTQLTAKDKEHDNDKLLQLATRVSSLADCCGVGGQHVDGYLKAAAQSMVAVINARGLAEQGRKTSRAAKEAIHALNQSIPA